MSFTTWIKRMVYPLYIYPRITKGTQKNLLQLFQLYQASKPDLNDDSKELKLFSNKEEDGIIIKIIALLNIQQGYFVDVGSNDCINSNCANLVFNFNWKGIFIDADKRLLNIGKRNYRWFGKDRGLKFVHSYLYPDNVNNIIAENITNTEIDFLSIDIDGNDYEIWKSIDCIAPKFVVVENKIEYGANDIVVPVNDKYSPDQWGASIVSMTKLAHQKGYKLIAVNKDGFNAFYLRNDIFDSKGLSELTIDSIVSNENIKASFYNEKKIDKMRNLLHQINVA